MSRKTPAILVIGYQAFDVIIPVAGAPGPDGKVECEQMRVGGGGPGATAAIALARLGAQVRFVGPLTDDVPGRLQRAELEAAGVDLSLSPVRQDAHSPLAAILVEPGGERTIYWARGKVPRLTPDEVDVNWLGDVDLVYCDGHEPEALLALAPAIHQRGLPLVMDAGSVRAGSADLVAVCTDVISSARFAPELTGESHPAAALHELARRGPRRVGMTFGDRGCLGLVDGQIQHVPAFRVTVQDTTGAGDAFHAGYAFARCRGADLLACLEFGAATAACKCRGWGGRQALPTLPEVEAMLSEGERLTRHPEY